MTTSNCTTIQESTAELIDEFTVQLIFGVLYSMVWVAGIVGNSLVLYVVSFNQVSLSVRSIFIGCLAVSDLLMSLTSLPITAITIFSRVWIFPSIFCKLIGIFQEGSIFVSSFTLTVIAIDRVLLITKPNKEIINYNRAIIVVIGIWALGYSLALPTGIHSGEAAYPGLCGVFCEEQWPDYSEALGRSNQRRIYGLTVLVLQFGIPALISSICYYIISRVMDSQLERRRGQTLLPESEMKLVSRKSRANKMMIVMVLGFIFAWVPINCINLYRDLISTFTVTTWFSMVFALCHVTAMMSAVLNPVIYSWFNPQFRSAIQSVFQRHRKQSLYSTKAHAELPSRASHHIMPVSSAARSDCKKSEVFLTTSTDTHLPGDQML
ncbi:unnamed protein product [Auanema sp. JU1783]|nr:unnamed protein product [Auanema sp. JU1783]